MTVRIPFIRIALKNRVVRINVYAEYLYSVASYRWFCTVLWTVIFRCRDLSAAIIDLITMLLEVEIRD